MSHEADGPFLAAIRAAPGDPQPHTIYLDWLFDQPGRYGDWLLRRVLLDPGDDGVRLKYATWLTETAGVVACPHCAYDGCTQWGESCAHCAGSHHLSDGRRERAEFIRVQCKLARRVEPTGDTRHEIDAGWESLDALRRRERELLEAHVRTWNPDWHGMPYQAWLTVADVQWSRGFIAQITLAAADLLAHAAAVFGAAPVTGVVLSDKRPGVGGGEYSWHRAGSRADVRVSGEQTIFLEGRLYKLLVGGRPAPFGTVRYYPTAETALADLSAACIRFGRSAAGLPAWEPADVRAGA